MKTAMLEAEMVMGGAVSEVLEKTGGWAVCVGQ
jgi:phage tail tube protein FII